VSARELITEHLDLWTGAVTKKSSSGRGSNGKVELTGVKKLRELILELAVRGKLVDQSPNDQPSQELLEQCLEAKQTALEEGKLKKARRHAPIDNQGVPFNLPNSWSWTRLDDLVRVINGRAYKKHEMLTEGAAGAPLLRVGNLFTSNDWYYSDLELEEDKYIDSGDLIYAWSASFGPFIWNGGRAIYHYHIWKLDLFDEAAIDKRFLYLYLQAVTEEIKSSGSGIAMIHMTKTKMEELVTPVPPLEEQHRIVQKVDELMALCDRLEQRTSDQLEAHETLVDTLLGTLTQSENATELADNWTRLAAHFDTLFTTEQSIDKLKQTILQLAVMGRLVEQHITDTTPSALIDNIAHEREELVGSGKIRKPKIPASMDLQTSPPFHVPRNWNWARLGELFAVVTDGDHQAPPKSEEGVPFLVIGNLNAGHIDFVGCKHVEENYYLKLDWSRKPANGDLLYTVTGSYGIPIKVLTSKAFCVQRHVAILRATVSTPRDYAKLVLESEYGQSYADEIATGIAQKTVPLTGLRKMPVPLPPEEEQHRIVQKVDELMALCDQLKERLNQASETRCQLAEAVVEGALN
jgi:type I restriction enzyme S subunit